MLKSANKSISGDGKKPTAKPREVLGEQNKPSASAALRHGAAQMRGNALSNSLMLQNSCWWKSSNLLPPSSQQRCIKGSSTPLATQFRETKWPRVSDYLPLLILACRISSLNQTLEVKQTWWDKNGGGHNAFRVLGMWHVSETLVLWYWRTRIVTAPCFLTYTQSLTTARSRAAASAAAKQGGEIVQCWYQAHLAAFFLKTHPNLSGRHSPPTALQKACGGSWTRTADPTSPDPCPEIPC